MIPKPLHNPLQKRPFPVAEIKPEDLDQMARSCCYENTNLKILTTGALKKMTRLGIDRNLQSEKNNKFRLQVGRNHANCPYLMIMILRIIPHN